MHNLEFFNPNPTTPAASEPSPRKDVLAMYLLSSFLISSLTGGTMGYAYGVGQLKPKTPESTLSGVAIGLAVAMVLVACSVVLEKLLPSNERHTTGHEFAPI